VRIVFAFGFVDRSRTYVYRAHIRSDNYQLIVLRDTCVCLRDDCVEPACRVLSNACQVALLCRGFGYCLVVAFPCCKYESSVVNVLRCWSGQNINSYCCVLLVAKPLRCLRTLHLWMSG
jgi:hypothetical protein